MNRSMFHVPGFRFVFRVAVPGSTFAVPCSDPAAIAVTELARNLEPRNIEQ